jgi:hypothetical protein
MSYATDDVGVAVHDPGAAKMMVGDLASVFAGFV